MFFSYKARNTYILENINIPFGPGELTLLTGLEDTYFRLMCGIIAGLFPVEDREVLPQIFVTNICRCRKIMIPQPDPFLHHRSKKIHEIKLIQIKK